MVSMLPWQHNCIPSCKNHMEHINISPLSLISLTAPFMLMAVSIYYASKRLSAEAVLLVAGSAIVFLYVYALPYSKP